MGAKPRRRPERLAEKLRCIRAALGLSQSEMIRRLGVEEFVTQKRVSEYELGKNEPSLTVLSQYAEVAGVCLDILAKDELDLPAKLPGVPKHEGVKRRTVSRSKKH